MQHLKLKSSTFKISFFFKIIIIVKYLMVKQKIIIFKFTALYQILKEIEQNLNFQITEIVEEKKLKNEISNSDDYLIVSKRKLANINQLLIFDNHKITIFKLIDKINISLLKKKFIQQSKETINDYILDLNAKELLKNEIKLKLTEKEIAIIMYLFKKDKPISIRELEKNVWNYQSNIETHTVETHIYRLRKKIIKVFNDEYFILSTKNGYEIKR